MVTDLPPPAGTPVEAGPVPARRNSPARTTVEPGAVDYGDGPAGLPPPAGTLSINTPPQWDTGSRSVEQKIVRRPGAGSRSVEQNIFRRPGAGSQSIEQNIESLVRLGSTVGPDDG
jgi:hypothetical protein